MHILEYLFWFSATLVVYGTVGYPALIWVLAKLAPKPVRKGERRCARQARARFHPYSMESTMSAKLTMIYWKGEHPTGTLKVREANLFLKILCGVNRRNTIAIDSGTPLMN